MAAGDAAGFSKGVTGFSSGVAGLEIGATGETSGFVADNAGGSSRLNWIFTLSSRSGANSPFGSSAAGVASTGTTGPRAGSVTTGSDVRTSGLGTSASRGGGTGRPRNACWA